MLFFILLGFSCVFRFDSVGFYVFSSLCMASLVRFFGLTSLAPFFGLTSLVPFFGLTSVVHFFRLTLLVHFFRLTSLVHFFRLTLYVHFFRLPERNEPKKGQRRRSSPTNMRSSAEARELAPPSAPLRHHSPLTASIALFVAGLSLKPHPKRTFFICARLREHVGRGPVVVCVFFGGRLLVLGERTGAGSLGQGR